MMRNFFLFLLIVLSFISCNKTEKTLHLAGEKCVYDDTKKEIIYKGGGIGIYKNKIFILDKEDWNIKVLNKNFDLIKKIPLKKGQGPGELQKLFGLKVIGDRIFIIGLLKVLKLDLTGKLIKEFRFNKVIFPFHCQTDGKSLFSIKFVSQKKDFPFEFNSMFLKTDLISGKSVSFGSISEDAIEFLKSRDDALLLNLHLSDKYFVVSNVKIPFVWIYDKNTVKLIKVVKLDLDGNFSIGEPFFDKRGNMFFFVLKDKTKLYLYCYNKEFEFLGIQESGLKTFPQFPVFLDSETILFFDKECEKLYITKLNPEFVLNNRLSVSLSEMINNRMNNNNYSAKEVGCGYIDFLKGSGFKKFLLESYWDFSQPIAFNDSFLLFSGSVKYPEVFKYDLKKEKFVNFGIKNSNFNKAKNFFYLYTGEKTFGVQGKILLKDGLKYILNVYDFNFQFLKTVVIPENRFFISYDYKSNISVLRNQKEESIELYSGDNLKTIITFNELRRKFGSGEKSFNCEAVFLKDKFVLFFVKDKYYMVFSNKGEMLKDGFLNFLSDNSEILSLAKLSDKDCYILAEKSEGDETALLLYGFSVDLSKEKLLLKVNIPLNFIAKVNEEGNILLSFPGKLDCFVLISKRGQYES